MAEERRSTEGLNGAVRVPGSVVVTTQQQPNNHDQVLQTSQQKSFTE